MTLNQIRRMNKHITIKGITNKSFSKYGRIITGYDFTEAISYVEKKTPVPEEGSLCVNTADTMEELEIAKELKYNFWGELDIQLGYCNGMNSKLNYLEYHKSSELLVAVTDLIIFLGRVQDIKEGQYESSRSEAFFIPEGVAIELYCSTLHSMPCRMETRGYRAVIALPLGTNTALKDRKKQEALLFSKNNWRIAHAEAFEYVNNEKQVGIAGDNMEIYLKKEL